MHTTKLCFWMCLIFAAATKVDAENASYFPRPESEGGWRKLESAEDIRRIAGMDPGKLDELKQWLLKSDNRDFAADVIRRGYVVLEVERGNSAKDDSRRVASVSKAICATVLAIASEKSQHKRTPKKMTFDDLAFQFIPQAQPLSDPRKAQITVKQLLNHTSGITPEATGAQNRGPWKHVLGYDGDPHTVTLAFDPGTACGYSTFALYHAALVCENVTGKPYDQFAIEALFKPIGAEKWWFQFFDGGDKDGNPNYGRHPNHSLGMPARDLARIAYCMLHDGRWREKQVIPEWFVHETAEATHNVKSLEMRWGHNSQMYSHGWELPARRAEKIEGRRSSGGIPADARLKSGSGGQLIAFVPSLDLVITRQTGSSGTWEYDEYLRRACAAVIKESSADHGRDLINGDKPCRQTSVSITEDRWLINGQATYPSSKAEGLLMNVRMANAVFEDSQNSGFDAAGNTSKFISEIPNYVSQGMGAFTLSLQGGFPGYEGAVNSAFNPNGSLRKSYLSRVREVVEACDKHGAVVLLGCYYQRQDQILNDETAVRAGVVNVAQWIREEGFKNVVLEIANEYAHNGYDHQILKSVAGEVELIKLAKQTNPELLVSTSGLGGGTLPDIVAQACDFLLIHFNTTELADIPKCIADLKQYGKPIVCNEDDKLGSEGAKAADLSVTHGASWGFMHVNRNQCVPLEFSGSQDDPIVYQRIKQLTSQE